MMNSDPSGYLHLGKHWWNSVWFIANAIDIIIITIPAFAAISSAFRAKSIAKAAARVASTMSRKELRKAFVELSVKIAVKTGITLIKSLAGAIVDAIFTITASSIGSLVVHIIDKLDGKRDNYIFA